MTAEFRAGAGRASIRYPTDTWPFDGFTGEHDPLNARVLVLQADKRIVFAVIDQTSLSPGPLGAARRVLAEVTGAAVVDVMVSVSHTFSAPHLVAPTEVEPNERSRAEARLDCVLKATRVAATEAIDSMRPAAVGSAYGRCAIALNRDVQLADGWGLGVGEEGFTDPTMLVTALVDESGTAFALLVNLGVQPSVMHGSVSATGDRWVTADLAGAAMDRVEADFPGAVAFFLVGAAGDQSPGLVAGDAGDAAFTVVDLLGERVALAVRKTAVSIDAVEWAPTLRLTESHLSLPGQLPTAREHIAPTLHPRYEHAEKTEAPFWVLHLADTVLVGVQVELSAVTGAEIRAASPFAHTGVVTMVNGGAKYLPDASAFDRGTYEAQSSRYARGGAELVAHAVVHHLMELDELTAQSEASGAAASVRQG